MTTPIKTWHLVVTSTALAMACIGDPPPVATGGGGGAVAGTGGAAGAGGGAGSSGAAGSAGTTGGASGSGGAGGSGSGGGGAAGTSPSCNRQAAFGAPVPVVALNSVQDDNAVDFSANGLTAYVSSQRSGGPGGLDIFSASRASTADAFGMLTPVPGVNTNAQEYSPRISADGLKLFFTAPKGNNHSGIVAATRSSLLTAFGSGAPLLNLGSNADEGGCFLTADGKSIYFSSNRAGGLGDEDIMVADLGTDGSFGTPRFVTELASSAQDANPVLTADGLVIYFSSQRSGVGQAEIYMAARSTVNASFGTPVPVAELNSAAQDWPASVSADGCTLYFCSERMAGTSGRTGADIFSATRGQ